MSDADSSPALTRRSRVRASPTVVVAVASTVANLLGYVFNAIMSHTLSVSGYGELAALLAVIVVATVPGTALQAVTARRISSGDGEHHVQRTTALIAVAVFAVALAVSPLLHRFLEIGTYPPVLWMAASLLPTTIAFGWQGLLQGYSRFTALGILLIAVQLARVLGGVVAATTGNGVSVALGAMTVFTAMVAAAAYPFLRASPPPATSRRAHLVVLRDVAGDISPILGVLVLSNLDLLLARHYLSHDDSGLYAAGNLLTRAAFWGPAFVVLVAYPRLALPDQRAAALRQGVRMLMVIAVLGLLASVVAGGLVPLLLGHRFADVADVAWLFTADGLTLVGVQFAVFAGLAVHDRRIGRLVWLGAVAECVVVALAAHGSLREIVSVALGCGLVLLATATVLELRRPIS